MACPSTPAHERAELKAAAKGLKGKGSSAKKALSSIKSMHKSMGSYR